MCVWCVRFRTDNLQASTYDISGKSGSSTFRPSLKKRKVFVADVCVDTLPLAEVMPVVAATSGANGGASGLPKFTCPLCSFTAKTFTQMRIHERIHTGERPYNCRFCDYRAAQSGMPVGTSCVRACMHSVCLDEHVP